MKEVAINLSLKYYRIFDRLRRRNVYSRQRKHMQNYRGTIVPTLLGGKQSTR